MWPQRVLDYRPQFSAPACALEIHTSTTVYRCRDLITHLITRDFSLSGENSSHLLSSDVGAREPLYWLVIWTYGTITASPSAKCPESLIPSFLCTSSSYPHG